MIGLSRGANTVLERRLREHPRHSPRGGSRTCSAGAVLNVVSQGETASTVSAQRPHQPRASPLHLHRRRIVAFGRLTWRRRLLDRRSLCRLWLPWWIAGWLRLARLSRERQHRTILQSGKCRVRLPSASPAVPTERHVDRVLPRLPEADSRCSQGSPLPLSHGVSPLALAIAGLPGPPDCRS